MSPIAESPTTSSRASDRSRSDGVVARWTVHLYRSAPGKVGVIVLAAALAFFIGLLAGGSPILAIAGALLVICACAEYLLPIQYTLREDRAEVKYGLVHLELPWERVQRVLVGEDGIRLSIFATDHPLDLMRGLKMRYAADGTSADAQHLPILAQEMAARARS